MDNIRQDLEAVRKLLSELRRGAIEEQGSHLVRIAEHLAWALENLERRTRYARRDQEDLERRLSRIESSVIFRSLRGIGAFWQDMRARAGQKLLRSPLHDFYLKLLSRGQEEDPYTLWAGRTEASLPDAAAQRAGSAAWNYRPLISVVIPVYKPRREWIAEAVESVCGQSYVEWELCICLDGPDDSLSAFLQSKAEGDARIRWTSTPQPTGISNALNTAGGLTRGEYLAFLDHDDVLSPFALYTVVQHLQTKRADVLYSDEDLLDAAGNRVRPNFKPDWSPDLLNSCMYPGHLLVIARDRLTEAGWFRHAFNGAQDYDLVLRLAGHGASFTHIPQILYHWRMHAGSTALAADAKPYAHEVGKRALTTALDGSGAPYTEVSDGPFPHTYTVLRRPQQSAGVSILIPSRNPALLQRCLRSLSQTRGSVERECIVIHHQGQGSDEQMKRVTETFACSVVPFTGAFNFSQMNNLAARQARYPNLLFLNDDVEARDSRSLDCLLAQVERKDVGIAGAVLLYPSGAIQHAGIVLGIGQGSGHIGRGQYSSDLWRWLRLTRDVSAVTGACMAVKGGAFADIGGFDEYFPVNYNDVDFCLRARAAGYRTVLESAAVLRHDEARSRSPGTTMSERERFFNRWGDLLERPDPFYSPWLSCSGEAILLNEL